MLRVQPHGEVQLDTKTRPGDPRLGPPQTRPNQHPPLYDVSLHNPQPLAVDPTNLPTAKEINRHHKVSQHPGRILEITTHRTHPKLRGPVPVPDSHLVHKERSGAIGLITGGKSQGQGWVASESCVETSHEVRSYRVRA